MSVKNRKCGLTLMEQLVVIAAMVVLAAISLPAVRAFLQTFESADAARTMISSALASARAIAAKEQRYAGIRFQKAGYYGDLTIGAENDKDLMRASQYIIFIIHDFDATGLKPGFRAVEGIEPIKLPDSVGVMDLKIRTSDEDDISNYTDIDSDEEISQAMDLRDTTTFSIIFSPQGKLVVRDVRVRNRDNKRKPDNFDQIESLDDIFNSAENIFQFQTGKFVQDDYAYLGLGQEPGRRSFIIYEKEKLQEAYQQNVPYSGYLEELALNKEIYINPYTGTMINSQKRVN
jgi:hypothetical protein